MNTVRKMVSGIAAVLIVAAQGVALDQGHIAAAPKGTVTVGELTVVSPERLVVAQLPEVTVIGERMVDDDTRLADVEPVMFEEVVITAPREVLMAVSVGESDAG